MKCRRTRVVTLLSLLVPLLSLASDQRSSFTFGGKQFYIGMSMSEAVQLFSDCCQLSPPIKAKIEKDPLTANGGHFILEKEGTETKIVGTVFFSDQRVTSMSRPIAEEVDTSNDDLVAFTRALKRVLQNDAGDTGRAATISVQHERFSNAESDLISIKFPDGRGIELEVGTLDRADARTNKRDFITANEILTR